MKRELLKSSEINLISIEKQKSPRILQILKNKNKNHLLFNNLTTKTCYYICQRSLSQSRGKFTEDVIGMDGLHTKDKMHKLDTRQWSRCSWSHSLHGFDSGNEYMKLTHRLDGMDFWSVRVSFSSSYFWNKFWLIARSS